MQIIEAPNAHNIRDTVDLKALYFKSTARIYIAFVNFTDLDITRPSTGTRVKVKISVPTDAPDAPNSPNAV
jgi:hypothetical protein